MKYGIGNYFSLPNEIFLLGLSSGELAVYSFLKRCENRKTHQCWPSYRTIGQAVRMSENTVRKYTLCLEERGLISTEPTEITTRAGQKRNGNLLYTLRPIQEVIDEHYDRQLDQLELVAARQRAMDLQDQWEGKRLLNRNLLPEEVIADLLILKFKQRAGIAGIADHPAVLKNLPGVVVRNRCVFDLPGVVREENAEVVQAQVQVFA